MLNTIMVAFHFSFKVIALSLFFFFFFICVNFILVDQIIRYPFEISSIEFYRNVY